MVYLDANPVIYAVEGDDEASEPVQTLLRALRARPGSVVTSELTLAEVLAPRAGMKRDPALARRYLDLLIDSRVIALHPVSRDILFETVAVRAVAAKAIRLPDAVHIETARLAGCRFFISNDLGVPMPAGLRLVKPDATSLVAVIEASR